MHSKNVDVFWGKLATMYKNNSFVTFGKIDCSGKTCDELKIYSYPELLWMTNGKIVGQFKPDRSIDGLRNYVDVRLEKLRKDSS